MPYDLERQAAEAAARAAAAFIRSHAGGLDRRHVRAKATHDLVTFVDEGAQRIVFDALREAFPDDDLLGEEGAEDVAARLGGERVWVVDPLDGTTNFTHGVPPYAVSIGLREAGEGVVGVVLDVASGELFSAVRGGPCTVDGAPARVSDTDRLDDALFATGFPFRDYRYVDGFLETFEALLRATRGLRRPGAAAVDLAWTAAGRFDGFYEAGLAPWDVAAGVVLVEAAGGRVAGLWEGADPVASGGLVAAAPGVFDALLDLTAPLGRAFRAAVEAGAPPILGGSGPADTPRNHPAPPPAPMSATRPTLLVADDYPENRQLFSIYLRASYDVVTAESGEEAIARLRETPVAAALLDLSFQGGMTGYDVVREIRESADLAALPTLALTAHATSEDRDRCLQAGFDAYLAKPVSRAQMLEAVQALLKAPASA